MAGESSVAELILKIVADSTEVRKALQEASDATVKFNKDTKESSQTSEAALNSSINKLDDHAKRSANTFSNWGQGLRQMSRNLAQFSALVMGPVVGALAVASKTNYNVKEAMGQLNGTLKIFSNDVAEAALPTIKKFTDKMKDLVIWFEKLPEKQKKSVVGDALIISGFTSVLAVVMRLLFYLSKVPPLFWQIWMGGMALFAGWKLGEWIESKKKEIQGFWNWVDAKLHPAPKNAMAFGWGGKGPGTGDDVKEVDLGRIEILATRVGQTLAKVGTLWNTTVTGFKNGLGAFLVAFGTWGGQMEKLATGFASSMADSFSNFFFDVFSGEIKSAKQYMEDFGKSILKLIANLISQLLAMWVVVRLLEMTPGGRVILGMMNWGGYDVKGEKKHEGGYIRKAHDGLSTGEIPIIAQKGEGFLSRNGMASLGGEDKLNSINSGNGVGGGATINLVQVIQAWGPEDVYRNRKMLASGMIEELERNGGLRTAVKKYG